MSDLLELLFSFIWNVYDTSDLVFLKEINDEIDIYNFDIWALLV